MRKLNCLQVEIAGQLSGQMADIVGGVVETVGEEPEPESEDIPEQHEEEEEELTKVSYLSNRFALRFDHKLFILLLYSRAIQNLSLWNWAILLRQYYF